MWIQSSNSLKLQSKRFSRSISVLILFRLQLSNEDERQRSIKQCLDRNPNAFKVKFTFKKIGLTA